MLKELRQLRKLSQEQLARRIGVSRSTVAMWETGKSQPDNETVIKIADLLNVSTDALLGRSHKEPRSKGTWINVLGQVAAGIPIEAIEDVIDQEEIPEEMARTGDFFGLRIHGDSMEPRMREGDVVIVRMQEDCTSGDIAIVLVNGDEATCKKIKKTPEGIMLISTNPAYEPMFYSNREIEELPVRILGKVVELRAKF